MGFNVKITRCAFFLNMEMEGILKTNYVMLQAGIFNYAQKIKRPNKPLHGTKKDRKKKNKFQLFCKVTTINKTRNVSVGARMARYL